MDFGGSRGHVLRCQGVNAAQGEPCQGIIDTPLTINVLDVGRDGQLVIGPR